MTNESALLVDLVIAVHDSSRPLERAIRSVLEPDASHGPWLRITVVCHNIGREEIEATLSPDVSRSVRFLELFDGIHSAAGPFNYGIAEARARYVSIMGSDDYLEPGALATWLARAERDSLIAVIPAERHAAGGKVRTPPVRPWRKGLLDAVKDRLAYRTAPLGLIQRQAVDRLGLHFMPDVGTGEDQLFSAKLWFSGERIGYAHGDPKYVVGDDAISRVTFTQRAFRDELRFIDELVVDCWFHELGNQEQLAIVTKLVRIHVFASVTSRSEKNVWSDEDRAYLTGLLGRLAQRFPGFERPLSIADRRLIESLGVDTALARVGELARARRRFGWPTTVLTRDPRGLFAVDGPIRFMIASALL